MSSVVYAKGIDAFMEGSIAILSDTIKATLFTSAYTYSNAHDFYDDAPTGRIATGTLASKTSSPSSNVWTFDAADLTLSSVTTGSTGTQVIIYKDTGVESTSPLIAKLDLSSSVVTNGGDIVLQWNASGLFTITCTNG